MYCIVLRCIGNICACFSGFSMFCLGDVMKFSDFLSFVMSLTRYCIVLWRIGNIFAWFLIFFLGFVMSLTRYCIVFLCRMGNICACFLWFSVISMFWLGDVMIFAWFHLKTQVFRAILGFHVNFMIRVSWMVVNNYDMYELFVYMILNVKCM